MSGRISAKGTPTDGSSRSGAVGQRLGALFHIETAPAFVTSSLRTDNMAVTDIWSDNPVLGLIEPVPIEDAFLLGVILKDLHNHEVWEDGRPCPRHSIKAGQFHLRDLRRKQGAMFEQPHYSMQVYLPRAALDQMADDVEARRIGDMRYRPGVPISDHVLWHLVSCLRPAFEHPEQVNRLFLEHVTLAIGTHVAQAYGDLKPGVRLRKGGLAGWQEKRAKELLGANLDGAASLRDVATQCGLSVSHFTRAFKATTGVAPHRWLVLSRVDAAKDQLRNPHRALADIAHECGFADQSHFTRVFSGVVGVSPGA
jgi:AraC-like DNA-binding protein